MAHAHYVRFLDGSRTLVTDHEYKYASLEGRRFESYAALKQEANALSEAELAERLAEGERPPDRRLTAIHAKQKPRLLEVFLYGAVVEPPPQASQLA